MSDTRDKTPEAAGSRALLNVLEDLKAENEARRKTEGELRAAEVRYRQLFELSPDGIVILDPPTARFLEFNEAAHRQLGYSREEFARLSVADVEIIEKPDEIREHISSVQSRGRDDFETLHRTKQGEIRNVQVTAQIMEILGAPVYYCIWRDITDRKRAEEKLRESEENMRFIVKHDPNAIAVYDSGLHYIAVSDRYLKDYGVKEEDILGKHHYEVFPEMPQRWKDVHQRCLAGAIERNDDDSFERPDGSITHNRWECRPWRRANGEIGGIITYTEVTTERKMAEKALREREQRLSSIYDTVGDCLFHLAVEPGGDFRFVSVNRAFVDVTGLQPGQVVGRTVSEIIPQPSLAVVLENYRRAIETKTVVRWEETSDYRTGRLVGEVSVAPVFDEQDRCTHLVGSVHDITERRRVVEEIRKLSTAVEQSTEGIAISGLDGIITYVNNAWCRMHGYEDSRDLLGKPLGVFHSLEQVADDVEPFNDKVLELGSFSGEVGHITRDGRVFPTLMTATLLKDERGKPYGLVAIAKDITERKRVEEIMMESDRRLNKLAAWVPGMIYQFKRSPDGNFSVPFSTEAIRGIFGCSPEDVREDFSPIARVIIPEDLNRVVASIEESAEHLTVWECEYRVRIPGGAVRWMLGQSTPERSADGSITWYGYNWDITERKEMEEAVQASLREKETLLREIHHRVKNNMQVISSLLNLQAGHVADEDARRILKEGQLRIRSMALIHEKLYQARDLSKIDFGPYIQSLASHLFQFFKVDTSAVRLETDLEDVHLDINTAVPCGLLVSELVSNALKHAFPGGRKGVVRVALRRAKDGVLKLVVADNGVGLPAGFDVRRAESFGLQIVDLLVGQLEATMEIGRKKGTAFTVVFRELEYKPRT